MRYHYFVVFISYKSIIILIYLAAVVTDAPGLVKGYAVHVFFLILALLVSATIAISNMVLGQELRGRAYMTKG